MRKMKDSGIAWIGEIPEECDIMRTSRAYSSVLGKMACSSPATPADKKLPYICAKDVHFDNVDFSDLKAMWFSPKEQELYSLAAGDLLVVEGGAGAGGAATIPSGTDVHGICFQNSLHRIRATSDAYNTRYLMYYIGMLVQGNYVDYVCNKATIPHFTKDKIMSIPLVKWPVEQQRAIVTFLDAKCSAMDEAIRKAERLIEKLDAFKQSLITETVTKGLHPEVARKDSGVEWIGEIPETWYVHKMGWSYNIELGKMLDEKRIDAQNTKSYLRNSDVQWGHINLDDLQEMTFKPEELKRYRVLPGDLLVCEGGEIGKCAIVPEDFPDDIYYQKALHRIRVRQGQNGNVRFLAYVLFCMAKNQCFTSSSDKATIAHLTGEQLKATKVPFPPADEQREIATFLEEKCAAIDANLAKRRALIERLSDYKRSLIYEVVTGKREVG